jgi:hypothetical protein
VAIGNKSGYTRWLELYPLWKLYFRKANRIDMEISSSRPVSRPVFGGARHPPRQWGFWRQKRKGPDQDFPGPGP